MLKKTFYAAVLSLTLVGYATLSVAADAKAGDCRSGDCKAMHSAEHHHDVAILTLVEKAQTSADHKFVSERYEEQASDYQHQAVEHEKLAAQYRKGGPSNPRANMTTAAAAAAHCDSQAKRMKEAAAEAREMAQLHGDMAKLTVPATK